MPAIFTTSHEINDFSGVAGFAFYTDKSNVLAAQTMLLDSFSDGVVDVELDVNARSLIFLATLELENCNLVKLTTVIEQQFSLSSIRFLILAKHVRIPQQLLYRTHHIATTTDGSSWSEIKNRTGRLDPKAKYTLEEIKRTYRNRVVGEELSPAQAA